MQPIHPPFADHALNQRVHAQRLMTEIFAAPERVLVIHYALQQLRRDQREIAPPVAAVAVRNLGSGQCRVFSIKSVADISGIALAGPPQPETLRRLEYALLYAFNEFLLEHVDHSFVHWYMRDDSFGFQALEHRYRKVLADLAQSLYGARGPAAAGPYGFAAGPTRFPVRIADARKIDLASIVRILFGADRISLHDLAARNGLGFRELIPGELEPAAFEAGNFAQLQWSTSTKTRVIAELLLLAREGRISVIERRHPAAQRAEPRIFINYRREDTEAAANRLHDRLSLVFGGDNVFIDTDDIPAGLDFVEHLSEQIRVADVFLAIIGRRWADVTDARGHLRLIDDRDFVRSEIRHALARDIPVIPVLVDGARLPSEIELPADIRSLLRRQSVEVRASDFNADCGRLIGKIGDTLRLQAARASVRA
jgi:hypothetical protein